MNLMRSIFVDDRAAVSFVIDGETLPALVKACESTRTGRGLVFDGATLTGRRFGYRLPEAWALVP